jgi:hypothetical protein
VELISRGRVNPGIVITTPHRAALNPSSSRRMSVSVQDLLQAVGAYIALPKSGAKLDPSIRVRAANLIRCEMRLKIGS